jgi:hypothetical protein
VCRAIKVLCVAPDPLRLAEVKRAAVAAEWELCRGAADTAEAFAQLDSERPLVLVVVDGFEAFVTSARERYPALRIVTDRELPEADAVASALGQLRDVIRATTRPRGPVR